jgi:hypothetical protein
MLEGSADAFAGDVVVLSENDANGHQDDRTSSVEVCTPPILCLKIRTCTLCVASFG